MSDSDPKLTLPGRTVGAISGSRANAECKFGSLIQSGPVTNHAPGPSQPANMDDLMVEFNKKLDQIAYDRLGVRLKPRTYTKPYPEYFDLQPYPPGYKVPEFSKFNG